ncbi:MAG: putative bifunctional diguanylate cyclase/phosphodiesterase [Gammaproteobacteria bacterium]
MQFKSDADPAAPALPGRQLSILLLEDHPGDALLMRALVMEAAPRLVCMQEVKSLDDACRLLRAVSFDAVLSDLDLPDSEGMETLRQLLLASDSAPVIVLTHREDEAFGLELIKRGASDYLVKGQADGTLILKTVRHAIERKEAERRFQMLSHYDKLTGLANREHFSDRLAQALARAERSGRLVALLFLDLDRFKAVNDTLGHLAGDALLVEVARRLKHCVRKVDTIARLGGDEFTVILEELEHPQDAHAVCNKIIRALEAPFHVQNHELYVTTSIGVTFYPIDDLTPNDLLRNADAAMYRAKEEGRNKFHVFTADLNAKAIRRLGLESALRHAIDRHELHLCYQPKLDVKSGSVIGAEALLRWTNPQFGVVSPADMIPVAEDTGLIVPIGAWVLQQACHDARQWHLSGYPGMRVAVNLSARQFRGQDLFGTVRKALSDAVIEPRMLQLEITESLLMEDTDRSVTALRELKSLGLEIFLDDFGTGYSSLAYLKKFPLDGLKIDRSFVRDLPHDADDEAITRAILALSAALRLRVVAEGVENEEQFRFLREAGCDEAQGYLFAPPLQYPEFLDWLEQLGKLDAALDSARPGQAARPLRSRRRARG